MSPQSAVKADFQGVPSHTVERERRSKKAQKISKLAIFSVLFSVLSFICGPLGFVPGIVMGHMGRARIRRYASLRGSGIALTGLIIGYVGFIVFIAALSLIIWFFLYLQSVDTSIPVVLR